MQTESEMSDYQPPAAADPKQTLSVRLPSSLLRRIGIIRDAWKVLARANGVDEGLIDGIDQTYVVTRLLTGRTDEELDQWGGCPETPAQVAAMHAAITAAAKKRP